MTYEEKSISHHEQLRGVVFDWLRHLDDVYSPVFDVPSPNGDTPDAKFWHERSQNFVIMIVSSLPTEDEIDRLMSMVASESTNGVDALGVIAAPNSIGKPFVQGYVFDDLFATDVWTPWLIESEIEE